MSRFAISLTTLALALGLLLAGCHMSRDTDASANGTSTTGKSDAKGEQKTRDSMMSKSMDVQDEHWASNPSSSATATTPVAASTAMSMPSSMPATGASSTMPATSRSSTGSEH